MTDTPEDKAVDMTINLKIGDIVRVGKYKFKIKESGKLDRNIAVLPEFKRIG